MTDIVERLRSPSGMEEGESISNVVARYRATMADAADEIDGLRAKIERLYRSITLGAAEAGPSFTDIKKEIGHAE